MDVESPEAVLDSVVSETAPVEPAEWSALARRRLRLAQLIGLALMLCGAGFFLAGANPKVQAANLLITAGLTFLMLGLVLIVAAARTRGIPPDHLYQPRSIVLPRMWFILVWGVGFGLSFFLVAANVSTATRHALTLLLSAALMISGAVWCFRWLSSKLRNEWPQQREVPPVFPLHWMPAWMVLWSGLWGVLSTLPAFALEGALTLLVAVLFRPALIGLARTTLNPAEVVQRLLDNPLPLVLGAIGAVIIAPMIEEAVKSFGLWLMRGSIRRPFDGWLLGFASGLGFGVLEGAFYLNNLGSWLLGGWLRLGALLLHGFATAIIGLAYARSLQTGRRRDLVGGYVRGVALHGVWNASALGVTGIVIGFVRPNAFIICAGVLCFTMLIALIVYALPRIALAGTQSSVQEAYQQSKLPLPQGWAPMLYNVGWRLMGNRPEYATSPSPPEATSEQPIV